MSQNDFDNDNDEVTDEGLDQILNAAFWPEADDAAVGRLQRVWADAVREQQPVERPRLIRSEVATVHPRRFASRVVAALGIVAGIVIAFFAGRWTQSVPQPAMNVVESAGRPEAEATTEPGNVERPSMDLPTRAMPESPSIVVQDSVHGIVGEPSTVLSPVPESQLGGRRGRTRTASLKQQLETVLTCIEQTANPQSSCVEPLLKWRRESEYVLWQVVQNATGQRRLAAITAIGFVGSDESVPSLLPGLADAELRETAKQAIMRCADVSTLAIFVRQTQEPELAAEFAQTLIGRPAMNSQPVFLQLVVHPDSRATCLAVVDDLSPAAIDVTFAAFDSNIVNERIAAAMVLGARSDARTLNRIVAAVRRYPTRWEPAAALMWNGSEEAIRVLNQMQREPALFAVLQTAAVQLQSLAGSWSVR